MIDRAQRFHKSKTPSGAQAAMARPRGDEDHSQRGFNFNPIFIPLNQLLVAILDFGLRPPARGATRAYAPEGFVVSLRSICFD